MGAAYRIHPRTLLQLDYQGGSGNFLTAGFTYNITPQLQFNPAVYYANASGHAAYGYAVLTWNVQASKGLPDRHLSRENRHGGHLPPKLPGSRVSG